MDASPSLARTGRPVNRAILLVVVGVFSLCVSDVFAKALTEHYSPMQIVFLRNIVAVPLVLAILLATGRGHAVGTRSLRLHAFRGLFSIGAAFFFFSSLLYLQLAEATALAFAAPIFVTALSVPLLGEHVGWRRWLAVLVGFLGILLIVRPGATTFQPAALFPVAGALCYAFFMISARKMGGSEGMWTVMFYICLFPLLYSAPFAFALWHPFTFAHAPLVVGIAVCATLGVTLITLGFQAAPPAVVAPFDYTALIWGSLFGWLFWGEVPDSWTYAGAAVIVASGIYIVFRERRADKAG